MAVLIPWARVLVAGDYLSTVELPELGDGEHGRAYLATLERLRPLVAAAEHVVPGHGPRAEQRARARGPGGEPRGALARLADLIVAIGAPAWIGAPSSIGSSAIVPALWAVISFSIFIASMMHSSWPSLTVSPCLTSTFHMFP